MCSYEYRCEHFNYQFHYLSISFFFVTANALRIVIHYYIKYLSITDFLNVWMYAAIMCKKKKKKLITNKHHHRITLQEIQMTLINSRHSKPMKKKKTAHFCVCFHFHSFLVCENCVIKIHIFWWCCFLVDMPFVDVM